MSVHHDLSVFEDRAFDRRKCCLKTKNVAVPVHGDNDLVSPVRLSELGELLPGRDRCAVDCNDRIAHLGSREGCRRRLV